MTYNPERMTEKKWYRIRSINSDVDRSFHILLKDSAGILHRMIIGSIKPGIPDIGNSITFGDGDNTDANKTYQVITEFDVNELKSGVYELGIHFQNGLTITTNGIVDNVTIIYE